MQDARIEPPLSSERNDARVGVGIARAGAPLAANLRSQATQPAAVPIHPEESATVTPYGTRRAGIWAVLVLMVVLGALLAIGLWPRMQAGKATAAVAADSRPTVVVVPAKRAKLETDLVLPGTMLPIQETPIYARTNGYVKRWFIDIGAKVTAGQLLAEIETPELDRELKQAIANLGQAKANLHLARTTAERWKSILKEKAVSPQEVDEKLGAHEARKADLAAAEANVQRLEELKSFERVTAPFAGTITARNIDVGQLISAGNTDPNRWMFRIAKTDTLRIYVNVPQSHTRLIAPGVNTTLILREFPEKTFTGKVLRTAGALDSQSKTLLTEVQVPNPGGELLAGMYAQVKFTLNPPQPAIVLPSNTLIVHADGPQVAAVNNDTVHMRKVTLGRDFGTQIEIISGLKDTEMIVTNPTDSLREGVNVKTTLAQAEKATSGPAAGVKPTGNGGPTDKPGAQNGQTAKPAEKKD
jgi:RND family efflux transporter MFP subunit